MSETRPRGTEQRAGEKVYVQKCEQCPCEVFTDKDGPLSKLIDSFQPMSQASPLDGYTRIFQVDADGDVLAGILELEGCLTHGSTMTEAAANLEEAKASWLAAAVEAGLQLPSPIDIVAAQRLVSKPPAALPVNERIYPCAVCGVLRSKAEGGTTFTVCDTCWDKEHPKSAATLPPCVNDTCLYSCHDDECKKAVEKGIPWPPKAESPRPTCFWHLECPESGVRCGVCAVVAGEPTRSVIKCLACGASAYYPVGSLGPVCCEVVPPVRDTEAK